MHRWIALLLGPTLLAGCQQEPAPGSPGHAAGRFAGIGVFDAGRLWAQTRGEPTPTDRAAARLADDEHIIVVLDSHTGEVRECGDHSGRCVRLNPWSGDVPMLPLTLQKHAADLVGDDAAAEPTVANTALAP